MKIIKYKTSKNHVKINHEKIRDFLLQYILTHSRLPSRNECHGFSRQRLGYHISKLKKKSAIERVGYAVWRVTETGQNLLRGSRESSKNIEIWGAGYKFIPDKEFLIDNLERVPRIKNGVRIYQGWINGCWVKHSIGDNKSSIVIKSSVEKSDDVFEAWTSAMNKVQECKKFLEEKYLVKLIPLERTEPDFIIKTNEGKKLAQQILSKYGRIRTDHVDIDTSKSGTFENPDFEVHTLEDAVNVADNFAIQNKADQIIKTMDGGFSTMHYLLTQQNELVRKLTRIMERIEGKITFKKHHKIVKKVLHKRKVTRSYQKLSRITKRLSKEELINRILRRLK